MGASKILIVEDEPNMVAGLRDNFEYEGFQVITALDGVEGLERALKDSPDLVVLDVMMPGMSGLELQQQLNVRGAIIPVVFITGHGDIPMAVEAMQHGAFDFLQKPFRDQDLIDRVQRALERDAANRAQLKETERIRSRLESLTPREREVLELVTLGKANKVMAHELGVSQRTVEIHRARVMEKMAAHSLAQLVRMMLTLRGSSPAPP